MDANMPGPYELERWWLDHDSGPSPAILVLLAACALVVVSSRAPGASCSKSYLLCAGSALFLTAGLIGYSHAVNRVLLGALLLLTPVVGEAMDILVTSKRPVALIGVSMLLCISIAWGGTVMIFNWTDRLVSISVLPGFRSVKDIGYWNTDFSDVPYRLRIPEYEQPYKSIASVIRSNGFTQIGIDSRVGNVPIYPLLRLLSDRRVSYVTDTLLKDKILATPFSPQAIVEIVPADQSTAASPGGGQRGRILYGPVQAKEFIIVLRETP